MNHIKRQLSFSSSIDIESKMLRTKFDEESLSNNYLENLSNEVFYEIFEYLEACDVYKAFSNLNIRFQNLINCRSFSLKIHLYPDSEFIFEHCCRHFIIPNQHRILSLHLEGQLLIDEFVKHCIIDSLFNRLESIVLNEVTNDKLLMILSYLNSLPHLFSLIIYMQNYYFNLDNIYRSIFSISTLKYSKLSIFDFVRRNNIIPVSIGEKFSVIKYLVIDYSCNFNELIFLLYHTPQLCHLICKQLVQLHENVSNDLSITSLYLTYISIGECHVMFDEFEIFIKKIASQLQVLRINIFRITAYLDANRWEKLIEQHMPYLHKFYFNYEQYINDDFNISPGYTFINRFTSTFWFERKWLSEIKINNGKMIFSIHPYRKEWFDFYEYTETDICSIEFSPRIQLTLEAHISDERNRLLIDKIIPSFNSIQFTHLNINCNQMSIGMLIEIIHLLPNINSLKISSLPIIQLNSLSVKDTKNHLSVSVNNKITKVKLDEVTEMKQIHFLINLCPRIQYFEVDCTTNINLEILIRFILIKQTKYIPYLNFLCLNVPKANEKMIQNLSIIIDSETLLDDYTIKRIGDKIFLQWELE